MKQIITNPQTGEVTTRDLTPEEYAALLPKLTREEQEAARKKAYAAEADPLFFKAQRGEATVDEWQVKLAEIKARYPYPEA